MGLSIIQNGVNKAAVKRHKYVGYRIIFKTMLFKYIIQFESFSSKKSYANVAFT